jgi:Domain of unknown function (DUF4160)
MPTIVEIAGIKIQMFYGDHNPPHVHAYGGGYAALIRIEDGEFLVGLLPRAKRRPVLAWIANHRAELIALWRQYTR